MHFQSSASEKAHLPNHVHKDSPGSNDGDGNITKDTCDTNDMVDSVLPPDKSKQKASDLQKLKANCKPEELQKLKIRCQVCKQTFTQ